MLAPFLKEESKMSYWYNNLSNEDIDKIIKIAWDMIGKYDEKNDHSDGRAQKLYFLKSPSLNGIFDSWNECNKVINKLKESEIPTLYWSERFDRIGKVRLDDLLNVTSSLTLAEVLIDGCERLKKEFLCFEDINMDDHKNFIFVDGSFNSKTKEYGYGGFLSYIEPDGTRSEITFSGKGNDKELIKLRNIAGELTGVYEGIKLAVSKGIKNLTIFYDYIGIYAWVYDIWEAKAEYTFMYREDITEMILLDEINIRFVKCKSHTGIDGNEIADKLAKEAVGIKTE